MKLKLLRAPILIFSYWTKEFHVHVDASIHVIDIVLAQPREDKIDHLIYFVNSKMVDVEKNYIFTKQEPLSMVYALQIFSSLSISNHIFLLYKS